MGNTHCPKGKAGGGQICKIINPCLFLTSYLEDLRQILMFGSHYMVMMRNVCNSLRKIGEY